MLDHQVKITVTKFEVSAFTQSRGRSESQI